MKRSARVTATTPRTTITVIDALAGLFDSVTSRPAFWCDSMMASDRTLGYKPSTSRIW